MKYTRYGICGQSGLQECKGGVFLSWVGEDNNFLSGSEYLKKTMGVAPARIRLHLQVRREYFNIRLQ